MKKYLLIATLCLITIGLCANHFEPAWMFAVPQNPYLAMNFFVYSGQVLSTDLVAGDEIGIFDGTTCVGAVKLTQPISAYSYSCVPINVSMEGGGVPGSATNGHFVTFKLWKSASSTEYTYPEMSVQFLWYYGSYNTVFETQGTCFINILSWLPPTGVVSHTLTPPPGPGGGYVSNVAFSGTGVLLNQMWVNSGGGGTMTAYSFDTPSTDISFTGTAPLNYSQYGWVIDPHNISYYASNDYPITVSFDISGLPGISDPSTITIYRRDIHGTGPYTAVPTTLNGNYLTASVTALGDFIFTSNSTENTLPVELSTFNAVITSTQDAVCLTWITESESNASGYYIYRGSANTLDSARRIDSFTPATNTSQTHQYTFTDAEVDAGNNYWYWLQTVGMNGFADFHGPVHVLIPDGHNVEPPPPIPTYMGLTNMFPNPFSPYLYVEYSLKSAGTVKLEVLNVKGQIVRSLMQASKAIGTYRSLWNGKDDRGSDCSSGMYLIRMTVGKQTWSRKVILSK